MDIKNNFSFSVILLIILVFISAIAVVYVRHSNRLLFIGIDGLAKKQDELILLRKKN